MKIPTDFVTTVITSEDKIAGHEACIIYLYYAMLNFFFHFLHPDLQVKTGEKCL